MSTQQNKKSPACGQGMGEIRRGKRLNLCLYNTTSRGLSQAVAPAEARATMKGERGEER